MDALAPVIAIFAVGIVMVLIAAAFSLRRSRQRLRIAREPEERHKHWRTELLEAMLQEVGHDTRTSVRLSKLRKRLGWDQTHLELVVDTLTERGLTEKTHWGKLLDVNETVSQSFGGAALRLTQVGLAQLEEARGGNQTQDLAPSATFTGPVTIAPNYFGHQEINQPVTYNGASLQEVAQFMQLWELAQREHPLDQALHRQVRDELSLLRAELSREEPDNAVVTESGRTLRSLAEGVAGNFLYAALVVWGHHLGF